MKYFIPFLLVLNLTTGIDFILYSTPQLRLTTFQVSSSHMGQMVIILDSAELELSFFLFFFFLRTVTWEIVIGDKERTTVE